MARGGARPGAGRPRKSATTADLPKSRKAPKGKAAPDVLLPDITEPAAAKGSTPLEYMLRVMNDVESDPMRRDRMAMAAAPFVHMRPADANPGKRKQQEAAAQQAVSKFKPAAPPRLVANNSK